MSEIEKMYKTIFGEFAPNCSLCAKLVSCEIFNNTHNCNKFECDYKRLFTAEKQLSLLAFFINRKVELSFKAEQGEITVEAISRGLAGIINRIWQDLTDAEKAETKNILEM